jgi:hypothetical protein
MASALDYVQISYKGHALLGAIPKRPDCARSWFKLCVGVKPSFGTFYCTGTTKTTLTADASTAGDLVFNDGNTSVTLKGIYIIKAEPIVGATADDTVFYKITLADNRIRWRHSLGTANYNTYPSNRQATAYEDLNGNHEYTWDQVIDDLIDDLTGSVSLNKNSLMPSGYNPRNIKAANRNVAPVLERALYECGVYLVPLITSAAENYKLYQVGAAKDATEYSTLSLLQYKLISGSLTVPPWRNSNILDPATVKVTGAQLPEDDTNDDDWVILGSSSMGGANGAKVYPSQFCYSDIETDGSVDSGAGSMASNLSGNNTDYFTIEIFGVDSNLILNSVFQEITYIFELNKGLRTRARSFRYEEDAQPNISNSFYTYGDFVLPGLSENTFWGIIQSYTSLGSNQWSYSVKRTSKTATGYSNWSGTGTAFTAYNSMEYINDGSGVEGNGVDIDGTDFPTGFSIQPIPAGSPVLIHKLDILNGGEPDEEYWFCVPNGIDGTCT